MFIEKAVMVLGEKVFFSNSNRTTDIHEQF